ncbi:MAG TPA: SpoIIE family protein phosphatase [Acidimicrobiales bacterium]|nr:SpoIIE family protein phosphatase [Acidimicrobiales bacterium]
MSERGASEVVRLQRLTAALAGATTAADVAAITVDAGLEAAGSRSGGVWLPRGGELVVVRATWLDGDQEARLTRVPLDADLPAAEVYRTAQPVWVASAAASLTRYPALGQTAGGYFALPLRGAAGVLGVFAGTMGDGSESPDDDDRTFLIAISDLCAQALERTQAYEREQRARRTLEFLAEATEVMIAALDPEEVLHRLVRLAVPRLARWCAVYVADAAGLRRAAVENAILDLTVDLAPSTFLRYGADNPVTRVFALGAPEDVRVDQALTRTFYDDAIVERVLATGITRGLIVPIRYRGSNVGVLVLALDEEGDTDEFRFAATGLAARAAIALENAERHRTESALVRQLAHLAEVVAQISGAESVEEVGKVFTSTASDVLGADLASLSVAEGPDTLHLVALSSRGVAAADPSWDRFRTDAANAVSEAVRTRAPVTATDADEIRRRWPGMIGEDVAERSVVTLPLVAVERCIGAIGLSFPVDRDFTDLDLKYLGALADSCAQAVERISATATATEAAGRLGFLAEASAALAGSLDYEATLRTVAALAVPRLADWCAIDLLEDGTLRRVAVSHPDPAKVELAHELNRRYPPDLAAPRGAPAVARTGVPELVEHVDEELLDALDVQGEVRDLVYALRLRSGLTVALKARDRVLGVLSFVYAESGRRYGPDDVRFAEDLARRAAVAIDNSQLHTETLQVALQLQHAVQPDAFPGTPDWEVAVHYRPAGRSDVGGDFFDAVPLEDGSIVALVGDVMGRGIAAAASMAQVRSAVRAYLADDPDPAAVIARLDTMFARLDLPPLVTLLYAVIDPGAEELRLVSAGHLPPVIVRATGAVEALELPKWPPLGVGQFSREVSVVPFRPPDTLLAFTDGLVERRGEDIDDGLRRLRDHAAGLRGPLDDALLARLADRLRQAGHDDDVTVLAVRERR